MSHISTVGPRLQHREPDSLFVVGTVSIELELKCLPIAPGIPSFYFVSNEVGAPLEM